MQPVLSFTLFIVICTTFLQGHCDEEEHGHDLKLSELAPEVQHDLLTFVSGKTNFTNVKRGCIGGPPNTSQVKFLLYDENDVNNPLQLYSSNLHHIDPERPIVYIIHGWLADAKMIGIPTLRNSYLKEGRSNVIVVDWSPMARVLYTLTYCYVPYIAEYVAEFMIQVSKSTNIPLSEVHIVGHSCGAQMAGFIGKYTNMYFSQKIGRITGLDPAGPIYQLVSEKKRLCPTDANFVEVVHSNAGLAGYLGRCGTVDYHLNCGTSQPLCLITKDDINPGTRISQLVCDHLRSMFVWADAVHTDQFKAKGCRKCPGFILGSCSTENKNPTFFEMGSLNPSGDNYYVPTHSKSPFAKGCAAYPKDNCY